MKTIVLHIFPDLDAITCAWLLTRYLPDWEDAEVVFTPQQKNWNNVVPDSNPDILYCDTGYGKFDHHHIKERTCASKIVFDYLVMMKHVTSKESGALSRIIDYVLDIDNFGEVNYPDPTSDKYEFCLHQLITGLKKKGMSDAALVQTVSMLLDGVLQLFVYKLKAENEIAKGFVFSSCITSFISIPIYSYLDVDASKFQIYTSRRSGNKEGNQGLYVWDIQTIITLIYY